LMLIAIVIISVFAIFYYDNTLPIRLRFDSLGLGIKYGILDKHRQLKYPLQDPWIWATRKNGDLQSSPDERFIRAVLTSPQPLKQQVKALFDVAYACGYHASEILLGLALLSITFLYTRRRNPIRSTHAHFLGPG
jgi:hypothetical protein